MTDEQRERKKAYLREWYAKNRERQIAAVAAWQRENRERSNANKRAYVERDPERRREQARRHAAKPEVRAKAAARPGRKEWQKARNKRDTETLTREQFKRWICLNGASIEFRNTPTEDAWSGCFVDELTWVIFEHDESLENGEALNEHSREGHA
jgi:hypothetical protein